MEYADSETQKKLIDACNLICEHVCGKLPEGWQVRLYFTKDDAWFELIDAGFCEIQVDSPDHGISVIDDLCVTANYLDAQQE